MGWSKNWLVVLQKHCLSPNIARKQRSTDPWAASGWGLAVVGKKYSAHQTKVEKYSVDRLSLVVANKCKFHENQSI